MRIHRFERLMALGITALLAAPASAQFTATIFISPCQMDIPVFSTATFTVLVCLEGPITDGAVGCDFRINGLPPGWISVVRPNPAAQSMNGDLFSDGGARLVFPSCQRPREGTLLDLYSFDLTPTDARTNVLLNVAASIPPADPNMNCPIVTGCQSPTGTKTCVNGWGAWINGGGCPLAVEPTTWTSLKALYE